MTTKKNRIAAETNTPERNGKAKKAPPPSSPQPRPARPKKRPKEPLRLSALDAAACVLTGAPEPLNCRQMIQQMAEHGLWRSPSGATPERTLYSALMNEINKKGDLSRFQRVERGRFALRGPTSDSER
jgi:hypothetical protein